MRIMGKPKRSPAEIAAAPAAPPVPECEYTWHDSISGWEEGRLGYERQQAARAAAAAAARPKVRVIDRGPQPAGYDPITSGLWRRYVEVYEFPEPAKPSVPARYDYNARSEWRDYVNVDGSIRSRPRGRWDI